MRASLIVTALSQAFRGQTVCSELLDWSQHPGLASEEVHQQTRRKIVEFQRLMAGCAGIGIVIACYWSSAQSAFIPLTARYLLGELS